LLEPVSGTHFHLERPHSRQRANFKLLARGLWIVDKKEVELWKKEVRWMADKRYGESMTEGIEDVGKQKQQACFTTD